MSQFLPHPVLNGLGDAQENFDSIDGHVLQTASNLSDVASIATARTNLGIRVGTVTVVFTASALSSAVSIVHSLGRVPLGIFATILGGDPGVTVSHFTQNNGSTTTASIQARASSAVSLSVVYSWLVIG